MKNNSSLQILESYKFFYKDYKDFYEMLLGVAKPIKIVSYKEIPELKKIIESELRYLDVVPKECFSNAAKISLIDSRINYVEGIYDSILPISHAWNVWENEYYFDLTIEFQNRLEKENNYIQLLNIDSSLVRKYMIKLGVYGSYMSYHYLNKKINLPWGI
jgi:hypothetical protein